MTLSLKKGEHLSTRTNSREEGCCRWFGQKEIPSRGVLLLLLLNTDKEFDAPWNAIAVKSGAREQHSGKRARAARECSSVWVLGVPVVKAKADGDALCALLNLQGVVDVVISNDGDCLLSGAKAV